MGSQARKAGEAPDRISTWRWAAPASQSLNSSTQRAAQTAADRPSVLQQQRVGERRRTRPRWVEAGRAMEENMPTYGRSGTEPTLSLWIIWLLSRVSYNSEISINHGSVSDNVLIFLINWTSLNSWQHFLIIIIILKDKLCFSTMCLNVSELFTYTSLTYS